MTRLAAASRTLWLGRLTTLLAALFTLDARALSWQEHDYLQSRVASGELPPINQRLPDKPLQDPLHGKTLGQPGGTLNLLMGKAKDTRQLVVYGYARLVGFNEELLLQADLLADYQVEQGRIFTLTLRPGHRWSDGHPFTSEDFRYYWEDVLNNKALSPFGIPNQLLVDGQPPQFEVLGPYQVRYSWDRPNPDFLLALAGPRPLYIYAPAHYLKQFHQRYADPQRLVQLVEQAKTKRKEWTALHHRMFHPYRFDNPDLPTLQPWLPTTAPPSERFVFERNPFYHRVDPQGYQLPYIDRIIINIASSKLVAAKTGSGESDLQGRYLEMSNYTFLREGAQRNAIDVRLWRTSRGSRVAIYPNLNATDPVWGPLLRDVRFRRALSLAVNRHEINQVIYFGLALEGADTLLPESPLYKPEYRSAWARFDLKHANRLLDELGLTRKDSRGIRLLPDGRPMEIIIQSAGESTEETDVLALVHDSWLEAGVKLHVKPTEREVFRNRVFSGDALMSVWTGLPNAIASADMTPAQLAPTDQQQLQWPMWGNYYQTGAGEAPSLPAVQQLMTLNQRWRDATNMAERRDVWQQMLTISSDQVFVIGTVARVLQPIVVRKGLNNVPEEGLWNWEPNAYFGVYRPDRFWLDADLREAE
ncbi:ABC transporter substrate-binding protein [Motiliproteus sediminis]|uniref:ABC transporter substrate-binding protein n=1 Tax=Motiliproteus sediminis TaxID=1468178 RepID=UPI001AF011CF|nr:ABC transporter substrate-binding protein [Motiliproteus sediminis]